MEQISRRDFFSRKVLGQVLQKAATIFPVAAEPAEVVPEVVPDAVDAVLGEEERTVMPEYFSSPLYSYALLSEMPWDMLAEEAKRLGIDYEGRQKIDVVREIFVGKAAAESEG